jgi:hypothetical protein
MFSDALLAQAISAYHEGGVRKPMFEIDEIK